MLIDTTQTRCAWATRQRLEMEYHDTEWGVPCYDDQKLFEFLVLDTFQAGLSWFIILQKREGFRAAFADFEAPTIADFDDEMIELLLQNKHIIRNRLKIRATVTNARAFLALQAELGSFSSFLWSFVEHKTIVNGWQTRTEVPATSPESDALSKALKKRGFKFCGSTTCYAFMQAAGLINDHTTDCFRFLEVARAQF
jgi:DNA-3-methyladenine glycosylase I